MMMVMMMMMMVVVVVVMVEDELGISGDRGGEVPDDQRRGWEAVPVVRLQDRGTDGRRSDDTADARNHTHERQLLSTGMYSRLSVSVRLSVCHKLVLRLQESQDLWRYRRSRVPRST